jgi:hypothetical protein
VTRVRDLARDTEPRIAYRNHRVISLTWLSASPSLTPAVACEHLIAQASPDTIAA